MTIRSLHALLPARNRLAPRLFSIALPCVAAPTVPPAASAADEIVIGASSPLSGPLAGFGSFQKWGYNRAVDEVNKAGGIAIGGKKVPVRLVLRDDKTDPNTTAANT